MTQMRFIYSAECSIYVRTYLIYGIFSRNTLSLIWIYRLQYVYTTYKSSPVCVDVELSRAETLVVLSRAIL
jgi:hypothetical protein